ncbi:class I SAM-dependent methyltransferase [Curtobacterium sp. NPDC089689]|uniref:class I SAM-dependent methyltransferase n=1 Tax=Curtobacterium sp. NPDC089689 TaxID=3363968 RepID=UPI00382D3C8C
MTFEQHARSFGSAVEAYEHGRPGYPAEVADWLVPHAARRLVDVGAGTGKFTRTLLGRGAEVVAVEPDPAMRARLATLLPDVRALDGTGEAVPLPDASADALTFAQSWHWVDPAAGITEAARVIRPGGVLGLVWNVRDESSDWAQRLGDVITRPEAQRMSYDDESVPDGPFGKREHRVFEWVHEQDRSAFLDMVLSRSYVIVLPDAERAGLRRAVEELLDTHPDTAGHDVVRVPYRTHVHRYERRP